MDNSRLYVFTEYLPVINVAIDFQAFQPLNVSTLICSSKRVSRYTFRDASYA